MDVIGFYHIVLYSKLVNTLTHIHTSCYIDLHLHRATYGDAYWFWIYSLGLVIFEDIVWV